MSPVETYCEELAALRSSGAVTPIFLQPELDANYQAVKSAAFAWNTGAIGK
jgi:hypothetical protein